MAVLEGQKIIPSGNGFAFLENFTKQVYGDRGRFDRNLERYFYSKEWCEGCRHVESVEEVPLITEEQIKQQIQWETAMRGKALQMQRFVAEHHEELSNEDYCAIAADMGLAPGPCRWEETLFPHVVNLWVSSEEDENAIQKQVEEHKQLIAIMGNMMMDTLSDRQIISYPQPGTGRLRAMLSQGYARNFYRGENAFFGKSRPSLYRNIPSDPKEAVIHRIIGFTRMYEFSMWIEKIDCVSRWPYGDVFHGAVAQHYGVPTNGLDITSDFKVALFFACCTFDWDLGSWRPLQKEEFENAVSRPNVTRLGGDSRYGMIFCAPVDISLMSQELNDPRLHLTCPTPVGYQPFMRCEHQSAYIIEAGEPYDLYLDETFSKFKFRLTEGLCQWIYQEMDRGLAIYPNEGLADCLSVINNIIRLEQYSKEALEAAIRNCVPGFSVDEAIIALKERGHICRQEVQWCSDEMLNRMNDQYSKSLYTESAYPNIRLQFSI
ncbi:MAG: FRG domain-containing protein [Oscillibacter sp.]|nr:FRG domain-containing protein [Oscillibacter sp.]